jgi:hypothetical protein
MKHAGIALYDLHACDYPSICTIADARETCKNGFSYFIQRTTACLYFLPPRLSGRLRDALPATALWL